ncbi:DEAD/DEAH box helicase family protein [Ancylomarina sp. 16SWW S1-10-2]|uniref:DEAD/DEAH box helicase family protein n=1 Tax=Ancylomarina sp. 16SWW S1-10-2 TaxID=2499681 RepID=UPI0012AE1561|nr:DEAD/DEAH box helicase family protein [Ancylomarina sp. 16SWW S1-10-2]MRT92393.1 DEAD/DEAH box helicase [Ancylomarina sp. 16SWW S1-10-2]
MHSNFSFLQGEWATIFKHVQKAEQRVKTEPISAAFYCRLTLETTVNQIYQENFLDRPYNADLYSMMNQDEFRHLMDDACFSGVFMHTRRIGNRASHGERIESKEALVALRYLYDFLKWFALRYNVSTPSLPDRFDENLIPKVGEKERKQIEIQNENERLLEELDHLQKKQHKEREKQQEAQKDDQARYEAFINEKQEKIAQLEAQQKTRDFTTLGREFTEAETRIYLIDEALKEAGWNNFREGYDIEFPVQGMPITGDNPKGNGFADYVLWDDNGLPLAVVEAKRSSNASEYGKVQAKLYADCLEKMKGQRPIIFYTNGYDSKIWDDTFYNPREIYGFLTKEELHWRIQQRDTRKDLRNYSMNPKIADRYYQEAAWKRVAEDFVKTSPQTKTTTGGKHTALLVMATGSGKTRTAASMVEILFKANWVKRVLFLADRNALVRQAKNSFGEHLKDLTSIDLTKEKEDDGTRLVFSTYQTMIGRIDSARNDGKRMYGVGHFDLIIIDEAHRSVYNKYKSIFDYFDAHIIGLTATPKGEIDHNTYELFGCPESDPTFEYELKAAVNDNYLVPPKKFELSTKFLREGIKYKELSEADKKKYEETFLDEETGLFPEEIRNSALSRWLFNRNTVNEILKGLMNNGLKIEGGDKIGRTIIFAANQDHAEFIVKCFNELYPEYSGANFIDVIHNKVSHAQSLIESFCDHDKECIPQIAVSVDMLDTGIDAPRVLNLVFFKMVRSYSKFWQMIGRGTRLCPDVFAPGEDKKEFYIFDTCQNFEFFEANPEGANTNMVKPVSQQIFEARLHVSQMLAQTGEDENIELANKHIDILHKQIECLDRNRFLVQMNQRYVDEYVNRERWNNISNDDIHKIEEHLSKLPLPEKTDESARRFDLMTLKMQMAYLMELSSKRGFVNNMTHIATLLSKKYTIPQVVHRKALIESMKEDEFYDGLKQTKLEQVREEVRDLLKYLDRTDKKIVYTNIKDEDSIFEEGKIVYAESSETYKSRVERFVREHKNNITISKLNTNKPITKAEVAELERLMFNGSEIGSKEDFEKNYGEQPLGKFIRGIVGLDVNAAKQAFADFLSNGQLNADQITFINTIINYLAVNGTIDKAMLDKAPFNEKHHQGIFGLFPDPAKITRIVSIIDQVNANVVA